MPKILKILWEGIESLTFAGAIFVICYLFLFQVSEVHGASSYPTLQENERLVLDKITYRFTKPQRGDFVIIYSPYDKNIDFVKRIIGLPNESIKISRCHVYINGTQLNEDYLGENICTQGGKFMQEDSDFEIPENKYVVMGDNRSNSSDSRSFGPIEKDNIIGKIQLRVLPFTKF